ncbi:MAG: glycine--tRNA ligase subunit beta [Rhodobacteraceae bacterium]|nr:glycine--tRNA ligase subunit beta [Paracoccaceae bacterium]|tara:strand:- start:1796 stop:3862 length:2067 start_codon:yes stop_codon:yes gene_type:complete
MKKAILFEIGTEELPATQIKNITKSLYESLSQKLEQNEFYFESKKVFSTPRRLAVIFYNIKDTTTEKELVKKGPKLSDSFKSSGQPTNVGNGFAKSVNQHIEELITIGSGPDARLAAKTKIKSAVLKEQAPSILESCLSQIQNAKGMFWGAGTLKFARPIRWVTIIIDDEVADGHIFNLKISNYSRGHRVLGQNKIKIPSAVQYPELLEKNKVIVDRDRRKKIIIEQIQEIAKTEMCRPLKAEPLIEEVVDLVEWPKAMIGTFDTKFLKMPKEIIVATMQDHQRYFPVENENGKLINKFIFIANNSTKNKKLIVEGNEKVLRPRLEDANFFYEEDSQTPIESRVSALKLTTYYKNLGSVYDKAIRVKKCVEIFCVDFKASKEITSEVAMLGYNDLPSRVVNEFPSLQGKMSAHFAEIHNYQQMTVKAISTFYHPRFHDDNLPQSPEGLCAAYAEKLDTIAGIFALGKKPTGDKDPFGLRRASAGIVRILVEGKIDVSLSRNITIALSNFETELNHNQTKDQIIRFIFDRFKSYLLEKNMDIGVIKCILNNDSGSIFDKFKQALAIQEFLKLNSSISIINGQKRIKNILKKNTYKEDLHFNQALCSEGAELELSENFNETQKIGTLYLKNKKYLEYLCNLTKLTQSIDRFFLEVMVFDNNEETAKNRISLLNSISKHLCLLGDISELNG